MMNVSSGLLSSATKEVKKSLNMNDAKFGSFGTANSLGRIISSTLFGMFNQVISRKWSTTIFVGFHAFFLLCFHITNNANILIIVRCLQGFTQIPQVNYILVCRVQFGIRIYITIQIFALEFLDSSLIYFLVNIPHSKGEYASKPNFNFLISSLYLSSTVER